MIWFDIIGVSLAFFSSVVFSAGLIKPTEQIRDENATYWDENAFTLTAELSSQPYFISAFILLITGSAVSLGGRISEVAGEGVLVGVLLSACISLLGYLGTALLFIRKTVTHARKKIAFRKKIFLEAVRMYLSELRAMESNSEQFRHKKDTYLQDLRDKAEQIKEPENEQELWVIQEMAPATKPKQIVEVLNRYVESVS